MAIARSAPRIIVAIVQSLNIESANSRVVGGEGAASVSHMECSITPLRSASMNAKTPRPETADRAFSVGSDSTSCILRRVSMTPNWTTSITDPRYTSIWMAESISALAIRNAPATAKKVNISHSREWATLAEKTHPSAPITAAPDTMTNMTVSKSMAMIRPPPWPPSFPSSASPSGRAWRVPCPPSPCGPTGVPWSCRRPSRGPPWRSRTSRRTRLS